MDSVSATLSTVSTSAGIGNGASDIRRLRRSIAPYRAAGGQLGETAAAMHEITETVNETANNAKRANEVVTTTRSDAEQSSDVVRRAVEAMNGIERSSSEISEIIAVIDGIAFQTNLLALNAGSRRPARAMRAKGFAVVASEVRARRSVGRCRQDVKAKINASTEQVDAGMELVAQAGAALTRITGRIGEINMLVSDIARPRRAAGNGSSAGQHRRVRNGRRDPAECGHGRRSDGGGAQPVEETDNMTRRSLASVCPIVRHRARARGSPVHQLQARVARRARDRGGAACRASNVAVAIDNGDWSSSDVHSWGAAEKRRWRVSRVARGKALVDRRHPSSSWAAAEVSG
ncbi:mcp [Acanthosepion pharaonis]|uniref:Mcp n=1 Tax=Acanthosepion pharaonis TaxID=158019 RepID=A0A812DPH3_ACAPH|nr:mcp [Sepia pharaonis]